MTRNRSRIAILMATYNGEEYLAQQLDSILSQTNEEWHLFVHDDGSQDNTLAILHTYIQKYPQRMTLLNYPSQGGAAKNFMSMLSEVDSEYYMFSDQDDVWLNDKIDIVYTKMQDLEAENAGKSIIVATDLRVVNENLEMIHPSLWEIGLIYPQLINNFDEMAASTLVSGCTCIINAKGKSVIQPWTKEITMHDAWFAACIMKHGGIVHCIPRQTILYRQHGDNTCGANDVRNRSLLARISRINLTITGNYALYRMLRKLGYGSLIKFIYYKLLYVKRFKQMPTAQ